MQVSDRGPLSEKAFRAHQHQPPSHTRNQIATHTRRQTYDLGVHKFGTRESEFVWRARKLCAQERATSAGARDVISAYRGVRTHTIVAGRRAISFHCARHDVEAHFEIES